MFLPKLDQASACNDVHKEIVSQFEIFGNNFFVIQSVGATRQALTRILSCKTPPLDMTTAGMEESPLRKIIKPNPSNLP